MVQVHEATIEVVKGLSSGSVTNMKSMVVMILGVEGEVFITCHRVHIRKIQYGALREFLVFN